MSPDVYITLAYTLFCVWMLWYFAREVKADRREQELRGIQGPHNRPDYFAARYDPHKYASHDPMPRRPR